MKYVGHTNIKTFLRYVRLNGEELRDVIDDNPVIRYEEKREFPEKPELPKFLVEDDLRGVIENHPLNIKQEGKRPNFLSKTVDITVN